MGELLPKVVSADPELPQKSIIELAARILCADGLVAFPTETVYALGAHAFSQHAIKKVFEVKGRGYNKPLIVGIDCVDTIEKLIAGKLPEVAVKLIEYFWPGPLTLVFYKSELVSDLITCGLSTVAIRMPAHRVALEIIKLSGGAVVVPSANLSGMPTATTAEEVIEYLGDKIDLIVDGGKAPLGIESTILDLTAKPPKILRHGAIAPERLQKIIAELL